MEIERKFLVKYVPDNISEYVHHEVSQGYIYTSPVIRIRKSDDRFYLTVKSDGFLKREEFEIDITEEAFKDLSLKCEGNIISKTRYKIPLEDGLTAELDVFHGAFEGLMYVEVEFPTEEAANSFIAPDYFGRDVTESEGYQNSALSAMDKDEIRRFLEDMIVNK